MSVLRWICLFVCGIAPLGAQQDATYVVAGSVTNAKTGEPIARALVELDPMPVSRDAIIPEKTAAVLTDATGVFRFTGVAKGNYRISARKPQFGQELEELAGQALEIDKAREDLRLSLSPLGAIEGKVVDQDGQPLRGVSVVAVTRPIEDGRRVSRFSRSVTTDDRGVYRLWNLARGDYYLSAVGRAGATSLLIGGLGADTSTSEGFAPVYYGGSPNIEGATPISIQAGTQAQADFRVTLEPAYKISGTLSNFIHDSTVSFQLFRGDEIVAPGRTTLDGSTGRFVFRDIVPGSYILRAAQANKTRAEVPITVDGDVNGVQIALAGGVDVKVSQMGGQNAEILLAVPRNKFARRSGGAYCSLTLTETRSRQRLVIRAETPRDPVFRGVVPGEYRIDAQCFGGYISSITSGTADLIANPVLRIQAGAAPPEIEIALKTDGGSAEVTFELDKPPAQVWMLLVPGSSTQGQPKMSRAFHVGEWQAVVTDVAPGDYTIYGFSTDQIEFRNPEVLRTLTGGTHIKIEPGAQQVTVKSLVR